MSKAALVALYPGFLSSLIVRTPSPGETTYNGLYGEAPPERGIFFRMQVYERVGISFVEVYKKGREIGHFVCKKAKKG